MAKDFKNINNPALKFITGAENDFIEPAEPITKKVKETKSKRLNLLVFPSVYEACKREADEQGESVNEIINEILKQYFSKE